MHHLITRSWRLITDPDKYTENPNELNIFAIFNPKDKLWYYSMGYHYVGTTDPWTMIASEKAWDDFVMEMKWGK